MTCTDVVALAGFKLNRVTPAGTTSEQPDRFVAPPRQRIRVTDKLRADVIRRYQAGETSREVAAETGASKATVLAILKEAGVPMRPSGARY